MFSERNNIHYFGKGAGCLNIKVKSDTLPIKTYSIKDSYLHISGNVPKLTVFNLSGVTNFKATFSTSLTSYSQNGTYLQLGEDSSNIYNFGRAGDRIIYTPPFTQQNISQPTDIEVVYDGSKFVISSKGVSLTKNATLSSTWDYWYSNIEANGNMSNLLIMPL